MPDPNIFWQTIATVNPIIALVYLAELRHLVGRTTLETRRWKLRIFYLVTAVFVALLLGLEYSSLRWLAAGLQQAQLQQAVVDKGLAAMFELTLFAVLLVIPLFELLIIYNARSIAALIATARALPSIRRNYKAGAQLRNTLLGASTQWTEARADLLAEQSYLMALLPTCSETTARQTRSRLEQLYRDISVATDLMASVNKPPTDICNVQAEANTAKIEADRETLVNALITLVSTLESGAD